MGAYTRYLEAAGEIAREVEYLELSGRADFQERFAEAMFYPGTPGT